MIDILYVYKVFRNIHIILVMTLSKDIDSEKKHLILQKLADLEEITGNNGEVFKARAYKKAAETILEIDNLTQLEQLKNKDGIGKTIYQKLEELLDTGKINAIEKEKNNPIHIFSKIYGVGPKKAQELANTFKTIDDIKKAVKDDPKLLNDKQKIGLKYYEDILQRIPRGEIDEYNQLVQRVVRELDSDLQVEIVGSYRRGNETSGDIDIIITSKDIKNFKKFINSFEEHGIITEYLSKGTKKCMIIGKLNDYPQRRIDFMYTSEKEFPFAILYFTGSKEFNVKMRAHALTRGLTLNEHEIKYIDATKTLDREFKTEKDIFDFLDIVYKEPQERKSGIITLVSHDESNVSDNNEGTMTIEDSKSNSNKKITGILKKSKTKSKTVMKNNTTRIETLVQKLKDASDAYYNSEAIISDKEFDELQDELRKLDPSNPVLSEIGAPVRSGKKIELPYFMPSMDKVKPDTLSKWIAKYNTNYVLSAKLDGVSALYIKKNGKEYLYTRGNGIIGQDITHLLKVLKPMQSKKTSDDFISRGELIISDKNFKEHFNEKKANPRNTMSGLISQKNPNKSDFQFVDFVSYEIIEPELSPLKQLQYSEQLGLKTVKYVTVDKVTVESVSEMLLDWRNSYEYTIDGIIVTYNSIFARTKENPKHSVAFKMIMEDQKAQSKVTDVSWQISKHGLAKPVVHVEPVKIGGVIVKKISGQNAKFIENKKIGKGAVIEIVRRGDVIPYIENIISPSENIGLPNFDYSWTDTRVDIVVSDESASEEQKIYSFLSGYNANGIGLGMVKKFRKAGFTKIQDVLNIQRDDLLKLDGFGTKSADKIVESLHKIKEEMRENIPKVMALSGVLGRGMGEKKLNEIFKKYPSILSDDLNNKNAIIQKIKDVPGFSTKTSTQFAEGIPQFIEFSKSVNIYDDIQSREQKIDSVRNEGPLLNKSFVFTGFRDKELESQIIKLGGEIKTSLSKNTYALIVKDRDVRNSKTENAKKQNIQIITKEGIIKKISVGQI